jgi:hypothetical protein
MVTPSSYLKTSSEKNRLGERGKWSAIDDDIGRLDGAI